MYIIYTFLTTLLDSVRALLGLISPLFAEAADFKNWPTWMRVVMSLVVIGTICFGLWLLGRIFQFDQLVSAPIEFIRGFYLPIFFLAMLAFSWMVWGLWSLLTSDTDAIEFPDIFENWMEAKQRLAASGVEYLDLPIFLVLGKPETGLDKFFLATGVKGIIRTPSQGQPALRVYAWDKAIFVVCPGASAWGQYCVALAEGGDVMGGGDPTQTNAPGATIGVGSPSGFIQGLDPTSKDRLSELTRKATRGEILSNEENEELRTLAELANQESTRLVNVNLPEEERSLQTRRLRFLCKLIRQERRPWCPINGVVVMVPWTGLESDQLTRVATGILTQELTAVREVFKQRYPTFAAVVDLEKNEGFVDFLTMFSPEQRKSRIGQRLPYVPTLSLTEIRDVFQQAAAWIGSNLIPSRIVAHLKFERPTEQVRTSFGNDVEHNKRLYALLRTVYDRAPRLGVLLANGLPPVGGRDEFAETPMLGGCYLTATGETPNQQAFIEGLFNRVIESQSAVSWSPEAFEEDARLNRLATLGYIASFTVLLISVLISLLLLKSKASL